MTHVPAAIAFLTIIESPFAGNVTQNLIYARNCIRHSIFLGETPFASHVFYTQHGILNDTDPGERELGINLGFRSLYQKQPPDIQQA